MKMQASYLVTFVCLSLLAGSISSATYDFDCDTMDLKSPKYASLDVASCPHDLSCKIRNSQEIEFEVFAAEGKAFSGIMLQVRKDDTPYGIFRTRSTGLSKVSVGEDYRVACPRESQGSTFYQAQVSEDDSDKTYVYARWDAHTDTDVVASEMTCVATILESATRRWVKVSVKAGRVVDRQPPQANEPVPQRAPSPVARQPAAAPQASAPDTRPQAPVSKPAPAPRPVNQDRGSYRVDRITFPSHCNGEGFARVPISHKGCDMYISARQNKARAVHYCDLGTCFDASQCACRPCESVTCKPSGSSYRDIQFDIYDNDGVKTGKIDWSKKRQPGLTAGFSEQTNVEGDLNPENVKERPEYGVARGSTNERSSQPTGSSFGQFLMSLFFKK